MSSPATSCSRRYTDNASTYCSRNRLITIASRNDLIPRFSVYQLGRGSDPVIVVASILPAVALIMSGFLRRERGATAGAGSSGGQPSDDYVILRGPNQTRRRQYANPTD